MIVETKLAMAARHVAEGKRIIARQRDLVAKQKAAGRGGDLSEELLAQFERTQAIFEEDLRAIEREQNSN